MKVNIQHTIEQPTLANNIETTRKALNFSIDLTINEKHNIIGLFGPSGAGKSTILKVLAGLIPSAKYSAHWDIWQFSNNLGYQNPCVYVGEDSQLFAHINLLDNLKLVQNQSSTHPQSPFTLDEVISLCELGELVLKMPSQLSSGEKQRSCFARALLCGKKILLLDEAFSALDWAKRMTFNRLLREIVEQHGYCVFMVSHSLRELSLCVTKLITINAGQVVETAKLNDALNNKLAIHKAGHEHYFSLITASFSHIDKQDPSLQIWTLLSSESKAGINNKQNIIYVKEQLTRVVNGIAQKQNINDESRIKAQTFIVDANKISISTSANHQTSMLNCLPVKVLEITHIDSGVIVCAKWQSQTLRSIITTKSFLQLNIQVDDTVFFVFKAL